MFWLSMGGVHLRSVEYLCVSMSMSILATSIIDYASTL